jgi:hypothetical protein
MIIKRLMSSGNNVPRTTPDSSIHRTRMTPGGRLPIA